MIGKGHRDEGIREDPDEKMGRREEENEIDKQKWRGWVKEMAIIKEWNIFHN